MFCKDNLILQLIYIFISSAYIYILYSLWRVWTSFTTCPHSLLYSVTYVHSWILPYFIILLTVSLNLCFVAAMYVFFLRYVCSHFKYSQFYIHQVVFLSTSIFSIKYTLFVTIHINNSWWIYVDEYCSDSYMYLFCWPIFCSVSFQYNFYDITTTFFHLYHELNVSYVFL